MRLILMHQTDEVLEFDIDPITGRVGYVRRLERSDLAPLGVFDNQWHGKPMTPEDALAWQLQWRRISPCRPDLGLILQATGAQSADELALRAHGFSLSDCFWYRFRDDSTTWAGSNFFDNGWDDSFGKAVLEGDYAALATASGAVPDVTCGGISRKAWVSTGDSPRLLKSSNDGTGVGAVGEALASRMLSRIMHASDYVHYGLERIDSTWFSSCAPMVKSGESLLNVGLVNRDDNTGGSDGSLVARSQWLEGCKRAFDLLDVTDRDAALCKMGVAATLLLRIDLNTRNYGVIRDANTGFVRAAPLFDLAGSFLTGAEHMLSFVASNLQLAQVAAQGILSALEKTWDYSWYDQSALSGFGEELQEGLASYSGWSDAHCAAVRALFESQVARFGAVAGIDVNA